MPPPADPAMNGSLLTQDFCKHLQLPSLFAIVHALKTNAHIYKKKKKERENAAFPAVC